MRVLIENINHTADHTSTLMLALTFIWMWLFAYCFIIKIVIRYFLYARRMLCFRPEFQKWSAMNTMLETESFKEFRQVFGRWFINRYDEEVFVHNKWFYLFFAYESLMLLAGIVYLVLLVALFFGGSGRVFGRYVTHIIVFGVGSAMLFWTALAMTANLYEQKFERERKLKREAEAVLKNQIRKEQRVKHGNKDRKNRRERVMRKRKK